MAEAAATVHGAVSIVNAIGTGRGATLGTSLSTTARVSVSPGRGIAINSANQSPKLINMTVRGIVPAAELERNRVSITVSTQVPTGCGLKSSSATSTAVSMACARLLNPDAGESDILSAGITASVESGVSITGAYDDVCGCYLGGFNVTDNKTLSLVQHMDAPSGLTAMIFVPDDRRRRNVRDLKRVSNLLGRAWTLAENGRHWDAMTMNGLAVSPILGPSHTLLNELHEGGALSASLSGNGPAVAAVVGPGGERRVKRVFGGMEGRTIVSPINNAKAECRGL